MLYRKKAFTSRIFGSEMQKSTFMKRNVSTVQLFIKLKCRRFHTGLVD